MFFVHQLGWNRGSIYSSRPLRLARRRGLFLFWRQGTQRLGTTAQTHTKVTQFKRELAHKQIVEEVFV